MKLNIGEAEAFIYATIFSSLFVISVYIWKPLVTPPAEIKQIWLKRWHNLKFADRNMIEEYEMRMRTKSVGLLVLLACVFLIAKSHLGERKDVSIMRWFGLSLDWQTVR